MNQTNTIWHKDFTLVIIGQIVSLFGNAILRFALPYYILEMSGSPALFGTVMAVSAIPMIIMSPIGGVLADRVNKKRIMVTLDFITATFVLIYFWVSGFAPIVPATITILMALFAIQGMYNPAVDSSLPMLVRNNQLVQANSVVLLVSQLSGMIGPALGGVLFAQFGINPILLVSAACLTLAAIMEIFIKIPDVKQKTTGSALKILIGDMKSGVRFVVKEKPILAKIAFIVFMLNFIFVPLLAIGVPVLVTQKLELDSRMLGISLGIMGAGGFLGGIMTGILGEKPRIQKCPLLLLASALSVTLAGIAFALNIGYMATYIILTAVLPIAMCFAIMYSIRVIAFIQRATPPEIIGKVMSIIVMLTLLAQPAGQYIYGILFEFFVEMPWIVIFASVIASTVVIVCSRGLFKNVE